MSEKSCIFAFEIVMYVTVTPVTFYKKTPYEIL